MHRTLPRVERTRGARFVLAALVAGLAWLGLCGGQRVHAAISGSNLLAYFKFDESSGTTAAGQVNAIDGTLNGFTSGYWVAGKTNNALNFSGSQRVNIPSGGTVDGITKTTGMTVAAWVLPSSIGADQSILQRQAGSTGSGEWYQFAIKGNGSLQVWMNGTGSVDCNSGALSWTASTWYHIAFTWDGSNVKLYRNGAQVGSNCAYAPASLTISNDGGELIIGRGKDNTTYSQSYSGKIDDLCIFKRVISAGELTDFANNLQPAAITTKYWISSSTANFSDDTKWSSTSTGSNDCPAPVAGDTAIFTSSYTGSATFASAPDVAGITVQSGYSGTVGTGTAISTVTLGAGGLTLQGGTFKLPSTTFTSSGGISFSAGTLDASNMTTWSWTGSFTQSGGTFVPPTTSMTVTADLNVSAGTFGAPPTLDVQGAFNITGGTFTHNSGLVKLTSSMAKTLKNAGGSFYDLQIGGAAAAETNLVGYWKLDENTGTSTADSSGSSLTGTLVNGSSANATWSTGQVGSAVTFSDQGVPTPHVKVNYGAAMANFSSNLTATAWVYTGGSGYSQVIVSRRKSTGTDQHFNFRYESGEIRLKMGSTYAGVTATLNTNTWTHFAVVYNGTSAQFYRNGAALGSAQALTNGIVAGDTTNAIYIGSEIENTSIYSGWNGRLDEVRLYSRTLTATEIDNIYDGYGAGGPAGGGATHTLGTSITVADDFTISSGAGLDLSSYTLTVGDAWSNSGTFTASTGTVALTGSSRNLPAETYYNLTVNATAGQTLTQTAALTVQNDLTISTGTLATANYAINVAGSFVNSGTFTCGTGTVTLSGTSAGKSLTSGGSSFYNLTINSSNGSGAWTLGSSTTTVTNTLAITSGTVTVADKTLTNTGVSTAAAVGAASGNTAAVTLTTGTLSASAGLTVNVTGTVSMSSTASLLLGSSTTLTVNGTLSESHTASYQDVAKTAGSKPSIASISGRYAFTVAGATAVLNLDGVDITATDTNGVSVTSATNSTFTAFKNLRFTGGTGARYVYVSATKLGLFMDDCYFDNATTANVAVADSSPASKDVRVSLRYKDATQNGSGAGESRDSDDDSAADGVADGAGGVVEWLTYFPDLTSTGTGSVAGFPTAAFDWDDFASYGTYVAMNDVNGSGDAILFARGSDGSNKAYSATITAANGDIIGTPRWWNATGSNTRYVFVATQTGSVGKIYKYQDTGSALTLVSNWPFSNGTYMGQITTPIAMDDQYLYVAANHPSDGSTKYIFRIDHTAANPNSSYTTYTYASSGATATAISASPALNWYTSKPYVFFVNQGRVVRTDGNNFASSIYGTAAAEAPTTTVSGRVAVFSNVLYYGDNSGVVAVKDANDTTAPYFANIWSYTSSSCTLCRILAMTVGFEPTDTSTYPRIYWGDGDGDAYAIKRNGVTTGGTDISGFPFVTSAYASTSTVSISAAPLYQNGIVVIGNDGGDVFVLNQATSGSGSPAVVQQKFLGGSISAISRDFLNGTYLVVAGIRLHVLSSYSDPDAYR